MANSDAEKPQVRGALKVTEVTMKKSAIGRLPWLVGAVLLLTWIAKRRSDRVSVRAYAAETPSQEQVPLRGEYVELERRPSDQRVNDFDALFAERILEFDETMEELVLTKQAFVREELVVRKDVSQKLETIVDTIRHTEVEVDDTRGDKRAMAERRTFAASDLQKHAEVVGSDGRRVGTIDHVDGQTRIKLCKHDSNDGQHHFIPMDWVESIQGESVRLSLPASQAMQGWTAAA